MEVFDFDIQKGLYHFGFEGLHTELHSQPVVEIILADKGTFTLIEGERKHENLTFAIIEANASHQIVCEAGILQILMVESHNTALDTFLRHSDINDKAYKGEDTKGIKKRFIQLIEFAKANDLKTPEEDRINKCIKFIEQSEVEYIKLVTSLTEEVHLSESRLSHLFKAHIGVSIKRYLVWNKLRHSIQRYMHSDMSLTEASLQSGFYDQAHMSNAFKSVLGVNPSKAYNS